jgi:hypothetical protein
MGEAMWLPDAGRESGSENLHAQLGFEKTQQIVDDYPLFGIRGLTEGAGWAEDGRMGVGFAKRIDGVWDVA